MSKKKMEIWGRSLDIDIVYDCYADEDILDSQRKSYEQFAAKYKGLLADAENQVKHYCKEKNPQDIKEVEIANIFKYVKPKTLYMPRFDDGLRRVALLCAYRFNPDDGLALVFENETLKTIGTGNFVC